MQLLNIFVCICVNRYIASANLLYSSFEKTGGPNILFNAPYVEQWWQNSTGFAINLKLHAEWLDLFATCLDTYTYYPQSRDNALLQLQKLMNYGANIVPNTTCWREYALFDTHNFDLDCTYAPSCILQSIDQLKLATKIAVKYSTYLLDIK